MTRQTQQRTKVKNRWWWQWDLIYGEYKIMMISSNSRLNISNIDFL